jgi:hypothetical protein
MTRLTKAALAAVLLAAGVSLVDAIYGPLSGGRGLPDDTGGPWWAVAALSILLVGTYVLLALLLVEAADRVDRGNRLVRGVRRVLAVDFVVLAAVIGLGRALGGFPSALSVLAGIGFLLMFVLGTVLGVALVRRSELRLSAVLLMAPLLLIAVSMLVDLVAPGWGHPGYAETSLYVGLVLLARDARCAPADQAVPAYTG